MYAMLRFGPDAKVAETLVGIAVAYINGQVDSDVGCCPAVSVNSVLFVHFLYLSDNLLAMMVSDRRDMFEPLVVTGTAHAHQLADVFYGIVAGQPFDYFKLFSFKRTYSGSPSEFI